MLFFTSLQHDFMLFVCVKGFRHKQLKPRCYISNVNNDNVVRAAKMQFHRDYLCVSEPTHESRTSRYMFTVTLCSSLVPRPLLPQGPGDKANFVEQQQKVYEFIMNNNH